MKRMTTGAALWLVAALQAMGANYTPSKSSTGNFVVLQGGQQGSLQRRSSARHYRGARIPQRIVGIACNDGYGTVLEDSTDHPWIQVWRRRPRSRSSRAMRSSSRRCRCRRRRLSGLRIRHRGVRVGRGRRRREMG